MRAGITALGWGFLIPLAGSAAAALLLVPVVAAGPQSARSAAFAWGTVAAAVLLHGLLGFLGARVAFRRLAAERLSSGALVCLTCGGPALATLLTQLGVAAQGRLGAALLVECGAAAGAAAGLLAASRARNR